MVSLSAGERPRQSPTYPKVSCPSMAPASDAVVASVWRFSSDVQLLFWGGQYASVTMTLTMLMTMRLYAVEKFPAAEMMAFLLVRMGVRFDQERWYEVFVLWFAPTERRDEDKTA